MAAGVEALELESLEPDDDEPAESDEEPPEAPELGVALELEPPRLSVL